MNFYDHQFIDATNPQRIGCGSCEAEGICIFIIPIFIINQTDIYVIFSASRSISHGSKVEGTWEPTVVAVRFHKDTSAPHYPPNGGTQRRHTDI